MTITRTTTGAAAALAAALVAMGAVACGSPPSDQAVTATPATPEQQRRYRVGADTAVLLELKSSDGVMAGTFVAPRDYAMAGGCTGSGPLALSAVPLRQKKAISSNLTVECGRGYSSIPRSSSAGATIRVEVRETKATEWGILYYYTPKR